MNENVLTIKQLAKALQVTEQHLYRELKQPDCKIPVIMIGNSKRFLLSEVLKAASLNDKSNIYLRSTVEHGDNNVLWLHFKTKTQSAMLNLNNIAFNKAGITKAAMVGAIEDYINNEK